MKKHLVLLVLALILVLTTGVFAAGEWEVVGGVNYNTFDLTVTVDGEEEEADEIIDDDLKSGFGFSGGVLYWVNDQLAVGGGYETASSSCDVEDFMESSLKAELDNKLSGPYGNVVYRVSEMVSLNGGLALYSQEIKAKPEGVDSFTLLEASGLGFLVGADVSYPLKDNIALTGNVSYRMAELDVDKVFEDDPDNLSEVEDATIDLSGFRVGAGVNIAF